MRRSASSFCFSRSSSACTSRATASTGMRTSMAPVALSTPGGTGRRERVGERRGGRRGRGKKKLTAFSIAGELFACDIVMCAPSPSDMSPHTHDQCEHAFLACASLRLILRRGGKPLVVVHRFGWQSLPLLVGLCRAAHLVPRHGQLAARRAAVGGSSCASRRRRLRGGDV